MIQRAAIGAALALLMTTGAFAQSNPPLETPGQTAPPPPALSGDAPTAGEDASPPGGPDDARPGPMGGDMDRDWGDRRRADRDHDRHDDDRRGWREHREMMRAHHGERGGMRAMRGMRGGEGAVFRFRSGGDDGSSFVIRCAARDTTEECVEAIMPMLERVLPNGAQSFDD